MFLNVDYTYKQIFGFITVVKQFNKLTHTGTKIASEFQIYTIC